MNIEIEGRVGSVISDKPNNTWEGYYDIGVWYNGYRHTKRVYFKDIKDFDNIPVQGDAILVEFCTESKTIEIK